MSVQHGYLGCWKCTEIYESDALEEIPIDDLSISVYLCTDCSVDFGEYLAGSASVTVQILHEWAFADELLWEYAPPKITYDDFPPAPAKEISPVRIGIAIRESGTGVLLGTVGDEALALGSEKKL